MRENALTDTYILNCYFEKKKKKLHMKTVPAYYWETKLLGLWTFFFPPLSKVILTHTLTKA